ncbi:uncharacterized protein [Arachis hypogaea]|uniref:uncharacterized protein n=1 Tax=Arachis hypogaea TaxID=3818 RepID=UPI003B221A27
MEGKSNSSDGSTGGGPTMDMQQFAAFFSIPIINSTILKPEKIDPNFKAWQRCNTYVVAWINLFLSPEIYQSVLWNNIGYELWNDLKHRYYQVTKKWRGSISGLDIVRQHRKEDRVTKFLRGLGEQYSTVKSQVVLMDDLPSVNRILSMITQQERQLFNFDNALDAKILAAFSQPDNKGRNSSKKGQSRIKLQCTHCEKSRHIVDNCYKKHGYSPNFKPRFEKKSPVLNCITAADNPENENDNFSVPQLVRGETTINEFIPEQREALLALLSKQDVPHSHSVNQISAKANPSPYKGRMVNILQFDSHVKALNISINKHKPCVIDTGATNHVSYTLVDFQNYFKVDPIIVKLPNGALTTSFIMGTVMFSDNLFLTNALFIPTFNFKLISVSKLTASLHCKMRFIDKACEIQDLHTLKIIGAASNVDGLYILHKEVKVLPHITATSRSQFSQSLWHVRLGHPSHDRLVALQKNFEFIYCTKRFSTHNSAALLESSIIPEVTDLRRSTRHTKPPTYLQDYECQTINTVSPSSQLTAQRYPLANVLSYTRLSPMHFAFSVAIQNLELKIYEDAITQTLERHKARLVAKGFTQVAGVDYRDIFSHVAKLGTLRVVLAVAAVKGWHLKQIDVNTAFLHGELDEEVYMKVPPDLEASPGQRKSDYSLFTKTTSLGFIAILVYVDDLVLTGDDLNEINSVKDVLHERFRIKDMGDLKYFFGLEGARSKAGIALYQRKYILDLLKETGFEGSNTRPDISYTIGKLSQFLDCATTEHLKAAHRVLRYVKGFPAAGLFLSAESDLQLTGFSDFDWAGCIDSRRSISAYCFYLGPSLVTWKRKKQLTVAASSSEVEYRALALATREAQWLSYVLQDLGVPITKPINLYCDSNSAIYIATNPVFHERTKHIEVDCHIVRDKLQEKFIHLLPISTNNQAADILTKPLALGPFNADYSKLGLLELFSPNAPSLREGVT